MIYKFQPFSTSKQLGKEYNAHCETVPNDDDWILILDYDAMILTPYTYMVIEEAIIKYPDTAVFGAVTNRVGVRCQRLLAEPDANDSIKYHIEIAKRQAMQYGAECINANFVAGFFMLFRKSYWKNNKFQEGIMDNIGQFFDRNFCKAAKRAGQPIRVIRGAYLFHCYRIDKHNWRDKKHLTNQPLPPLKDITLW